MLPVLEGTIARRILLNFRIRPEALEKLLPDSVEAEAHNGWAIAGVCLIRLEKLRPKGLPGGVGISSENMAHRISIRYMSKDGMKPGVFIWRRETDRKMVQLLGGRAFPGVHHGATFDVDENPAGISMDVRSDDGKTDIAFSANYLPSWQPTPAFATFEEVSGFFRQGDCGFSCSLRGDKLEGIQLRMLRWEMTPLDVQLKRAAFYFDTSRFPSGSVEFDCGLAMRGLPHEWHELEDVPELAGIVRE
jgi:uncharacterized protein YqjF (DUF2071 family)